MLIDPEEILNFWFYEVGPDKWFNQDPALDAIMRDRFLSAYERASLDELREWEAQPESMLALLLLLDQFPRRMFRGTARAFASDDMAMELARQAIINHFDDRIDRGYKLIFYLPFVHSERIGDQRLASFYIRERTKMPEWVDRAEWCSIVIQCFNRFPHRNVALGRESSADELEFLKQNDDDLGF